MMAKMQNNALFCTFAAPFEGEVQVTLGGMLVSPSHPCKESLPVLGKNGIRHNGITHLNHTLVAQMQHFTNIRFTDTLAIQLEMSKIMGDDIIPLFIPVASHELVIHLPAIFHKSLINQIVIQCFHFFYSCLLYSSPSSVFQPPKVVFLCTKVEKNEEAKRLTREALLKQWQILQKKDGNNG